ncbi:MAG: Na/Pi cotransporter family protein [Oscillospiraceae bacterium]|nr:Na/Pi cotransporter family protein [Oscillospiraceae bacterium]
MEISEIISLCSGIALFLFGMTLMGDGLKRVAGNRLELVLYRLSSTTLRGVLLGTGVTAVIQSSCATSVMVVGFVNANMMKRRQAIGVILGAILGTSVTGWVISLSYLEGSSGVLQLLSTATLTGLVAIVGVILRVFSKNQTNHHIGDILMGFAILMFGMSTMSGSVSALGEQPWFTNILSSMKNPILGILVGAAFTAILQSASAAVGIVQALSFVMTFNAALPLLMGIAIGASFPVLLSALGANTDGKRTAFVYLVASTIGVLVCASLFYLADAIFRFDNLQTLMNPFSVAMVNSFLRLAMVLLLLPFIDALDALVCLLVREKKGKEEDPAMRLEERFLAHPSLAVEQSRLTINDMAERAREAISSALALTANYSKEGFEAVKRMENDCDRFEDALGSYLVKLTGRELSRKQNEDVSKYLHTITDFERISDHARNIAESAAEIHEKKMDFSVDATRELATISAAIREIMRLTVEAFIENDLTLAVRVEPLEEVIDGLCDEAKSNHVERLQQGHCTIQQGFVFNDLLTGMERVGDHCSNIALAMLELAGDSFDTHASQNRMKDGPSQDFQAAFEDYTARFSL